MMDIAFDRQLSPENPSHAGAVAAGVARTPSTVAVGPPRAGLAGTLGQTAKIMIVDDEPVNVKVVQKHLKLAGYQHFVTSTDPRPVMDMIVRETPDVVLLDVMMPVVSGLDILRAVREDERVDAHPGDRADRRRQRRDADGGVEPRGHGLSEQTGARGRTGGAGAQRFARQGAPRPPERVRAATWKTEVRRRTAELAASRLELIHCLARAAEYRDNETGRHVVRVGRYAELVARQAGAGRRDRRTDRPCRPAARHGQSRHSRLHPAETGQTRPRRVRGHAEAQQLRHAHLRAHVPGTNGKPTSPTPSWAR